MKPNFWQRAKYAVTGRASRPRRRVRREVKVAPFQWPGYVEGQPQWQIVNYDAYVNEGFNLNTLIYSAIMYKARAQIAAPLLAWEGSPDDPQPLPLDDPLSRLVARPNPHQSMVEFRQQSVVYLNIAGDCFTLLDRPSINAQPTALYTLRPDRVLIIPGKEDGQATIKGFAYVPEGKSAFTRASPNTRRQMMDEDRAIMIPPSEMMHTKYPNPGDRLEGMGYGLSPISPIARSADVDNSITHFLKLFFDHGVMLPGVLSSDQPMDEAVIPRIKERWAEMYGGYYNWAENIGVLERGLTYQRVGLNFDEMGFGELDERNETRILGPLGVPPILVGSRIGLLRSTYSNYEQARQAFWEDTMVPENSLFEVDYQYYLNDGDQFVAFDYAQVPAFQKLRQAHQDRMLDGLKAGGVRRGEYRRAMGLPTLGPAEDNVFVISPLMIEVPAIGEGDTDTGSDGAQSDDDTRKVIPIGAAKKKSRALTTEQKVRAAKQIDATAQDWEEQYGEAGEDALEKDRRAVLVRLNAAKALFLRLKQSIEWEIVARDWTDYFENEAPENWRAEFMPLVRGTTSDVNDFWTAELGIQFNVQNLVEQAALEFQVYGMTFSEPILETTEKDLFALLKTASDEGWSIERLNNGIDVLFKEYLDADFEMTDEQRAWFVNRRPEYRVNLIGRTESMHAANFGSTELFRAYGAERHEWANAGDNRVRDSHRPKPPNGQVVVIGTPFDVGDSLMLYPLDGSLGAPAKEIIQCRCTTLPAFDEGE